VIGNPLIRLRAIRYMGQ